MAEITKYHEHKGGFSSKSLCSLIKEYYGKSFSLFEISKILMLDRSFQSVGKGCYTLNKTMLSHEEAEPDNSEHNIPEKTVPVETETIPNQDDYPPVTPEVQWTDTEAIQADGNAAEKLTAAPIEIETAPDQSDYPPVTPEVQRTDAEVIQVNENETEDLTIESIIEVIKENSDNLQYEYGFGAYEIKTLLSHKGITTASEDQIEALMSECSELQEIEDGYYALSENDNEDNTHVELVSLIEDKPETMTSEATIPDTVPVEPQAISADSMHIVLRLNGNIIRAYDYSDALNKVCEFSINCKPFRMARIAGQAIRLNGNSVFYRKAVPVDGYNKLSTEEAKPAKVQVTNGENAVSPIVNEDTNTTSSVIADKTGNKTSNVSNEDSKTTSEKPIAETSDKANPTSAVAPEKPRPAKSSVQILYERLKKDMDKEQEAIITAFTDMITPVGKAFESIQGEINKSRELGTENIALKSQITDLEAQLSEYRSRLQTANQSLMAAKAENDELKNQLSSLESQNTELDSKLNDAYAINSRESSLEAEKVRSELKKAFSFLYEDWLEYEFSDVSEENYESLQAIIKKIFRSLERNGIDFKGNN